MNGWAKNLDLYSTSHDTGTQGSTVHIGPKTIFSPLPWCRKIFFPLPRYADIYPFALFMPLFFPLWHFYNLLTSLFLYLSYFFPFLLNFLLFLFPFSYFPPKWHGRYSPPQGKGVFYFATPLMLRCCKTNWSELETSDSILCIIGARFLTVSYLTFS